MLSRSNFCISRSRLWHFEDIGSSHKLGGPGILVITKGTVDVFDELAVLIVKGLLTLPTNLLLSSQHHLTVPVVFIVKGEVTFRHGVIEGLGGADPPKSLFNHFVSL